jgi:hypothetical protein
LLALIRVWLTRNPLPGGINGIPPSLPANREICQLPYALVPLIRAAETNNQAVGAVVGGAAQELPISVMVVTD